MVTRVPESTSASGEDRFGVTRTRPSSIGASSCRARDPYGHLTVEA